ncbi:MAG: septal ring lytic transglycosylase RlpA family protein [Hyphomicrobiales bacterium]|nr:septal ring lytic transglycosylase RlpA family protein [Hyphomicrobiales bacterium]
MTRIFDVAGASGKRTRAFGIAVARVAIAMGATAMAGCAMFQQQTASRGHGKEYFPEGKYGRASPRLVAGGAIPKGGGTYLVGRPYTVAGRTYVPHENPHYVAMGMGSWYGSAFQGRRTSNGEIYDKNAITAAHPTMPLPSYARVTNLRNGKSIIVRVNDRGPFAAGRVMDVSERVADLLGYRLAGTGHIKVEYVGPAPLAGSSYRMLASTLSEGSPAQLGAGETMIAQAPPALPPKVFAPPPTPVATALAAAEPAAEMPPPPPARPADVFASAAPRAVKQKKILIPFPPDASTGQALY